MLTRLQLYIVVALSGFVLASLVVYAIRKDAEQDLATKIERQNNEAASKSDTARSNYDICLDGGGLWNFRAGKCDGPTPYRGD